MVRYEIKFYVVKLGNNRKICHFVFTYLALRISYRNVLRNVQILARWVRVLFTPSLGLFYNIGT